MIVIVFFTLELILGANIFCNGFEVLRDVGVCFRKQKGFGVGPSIEGLFYS